MSMTKRVIIFIDDKQISDISTIHYVKCMERIDSLIKEMLPFEDGWVVSQDWEMMKNGEASKYSANGDSDVACFISNARMLNIKDHTTLCAVEFKIDNLLGQFLTN